MSRLQVTLYGDDAQWFREIQDELSPERDGQTITNADTLRNLMDEFDSSR